MWKFRSSSVALLLTLATTITNPGTEARISAAECGPDGCRLPPVGYDSRERSGDLRYRESDLLPTSREPGPPPVSSPSGYIEHCPDGQCAAGRPRPIAGFPYVTEHAYHSSTDSNRANPFRPAGYDPESPRRSHRSDRRPLPVSLSSPVGGAGISWQTSLRRAVDLAEQEQRPLLVQVSAEWCPHCERMKEETWTNSQLSRQVNRQFIAVSVDADEQREFVQRMGISSLPTTLVVAPDLRILQRIQGFQSADQMLRTLSR